MKEYIKENKKEYKKEYKKEKNKQGENLSMIKRMKTNKGIKEKGI